MAAQPQPEGQPSPRPVHSIRYMHGARFLRATIAERHGRAVAKSATSMLWSLLLTCDAMPGVMNRLRGGGWVRFWTSQLVELSGEAERTQRRLRSVLREVGALEERHLTSGQIAMRFCFTKLLAASPAIVGAPDGDVTVRGPEAPRKTVAAKATVAKAAAKKRSASLADIRPYGAPDLQTPSATGTVSPARVREAVGEGRAPTNELEIPERIDREPDRPTTSVGASTGDADATRLEPLSKADRELVADVFQAFSEHPSVARLARREPLRTPAAQATARRVAAMIREGVPADALASATTAHLDAITRQTGAAVWSPTYCEPAYDCLHSEWTMRRAQQRRLRDERERRALHAAALRDEVVDDALV
ncbi:hypothetical protein HN766_09495, partial [Candidatus Poribacteria bacterium]|nr:hypothetical protein [Candidatus Poribacteria bacterium]